MNKIFYGGIEIGGTKFICAVGNAEGKLIKKTRIPTTTATETMLQVISFFKEVQKEYLFSAIGLTSFGITYLDPQSPKYGHFYAKHKGISWEDVNIVGIIKEAFPLLPIGFDTDVNAAVLGESRWGNGKNLNNLVYWTVGTGIGAGVIIEGKIAHGMLNFEMGHNFVPHDKINDPFPGVCLYHKDCLEGLASGPAVTARWQVESIQDLPPGHSAFDLEATYLAYAMANCIMSFSPQRIILGGGVMQCKELFSKIRPKTLSLLNNFIKHETIIDNIDNYIVPQGLEGNSGVMGAIILAEQALTKKR